jgi:DNA-binding transcriptional ArsR family regulator
MYRVEVDWAPAYELDQSFGALLAGSDQKVMDLGPAWARQVRQRLDSRLLALIPPLQQRRHGDLIQLLIWQCPGERDADSFLRWMRSLSLGELYELLAPHAREEPSALPRDLIGMRDRVGEALLLWNEQYFRHVDSAVLAALQADADRTRLRVDTVPPETLVEETTNGVYFAPEPLPELVLLVPQWHFRPWNIFAGFRHMQVIKYPVDALPPIAGEPPPGLLRLTRVLSDESRLRILRFIAGEPRTFTDLVGLTGLSKSTVSHHKITLRAAGLVRVIATGDPGRGKKHSSYELRPHALDALSARLRAYLTEE